MRSLSARLLVFTILFVMLAEVLLFVPSLARYRESFLQDRLSRANLAIHAIDATPDGVVSDALTRQLLEEVGVQAISVRRGDMRLSLIADQPPMVDASFDLREATTLSLIMDALEVYFSENRRVIRVIGAVESHEVPEIAITINEKPVAEALTNFAWRIFWLSIAISIVTAGLLFFVLQWMLIRPMRRITQAMITFRDDPEDGSRVLRSSLRQDEIGIAERELATMQESLRQALQQKEHLAALGGAVAKINHDLKGILSRAILVFDNLEESQDPEVRKIAPTLISSIDRAVALCSETLSYVGTEQPKIQWEVFAITDIISELTEQSPDTTQITSTVPHGFRIEADKTQMFRVLSNLVNNAIEAGSSEVQFSADVQDQRLTLSVGDNGPGMPPRAQENLFKPFKGSTKPNGAGLGLASSRELIRAHGGELSLTETSGEGTVFTLHLPLRRR